VESTGNGTNNIIIFDTNLCDGEQSLGTSMNLDEKFHIASMSETLVVIGNVRY
jgi:isopropylmalate/homocitrate/citramalate synthase